MQEKFKKFMIGRYGADELTKCLIVICMIVLVISFFVRFPIILLMSLVLLVVCYYRMFSRNIQKRYSENQVYLNKTEAIRKKFSKIRNRLKDQKMYHIYTCPQCKQKIRIPRGKGKICVTCPKCKKEFIKKA